MVHRVLGGTAVLAIVGGCASTPNVTVSYYFPKAETRVAITQTVGCDPTNTYLQAVATVTPATAYSSDLNAPPGQLTFSSLDGPLSDTDTALTFTDDGRLSGINATSTGEADTIIKDVISVAAAIAPAAIAMVEPSYPNQACHVVAKYGNGKSQSGSGGSSTLTLTYSLTFLYKKSNNEPLNISPDPAYSVGYDPSPRQQIDLIPDAGSAAAYEALRSALKSPPFTLKVTTATGQYQSAAVWNGHTVWNTNDPPSSDVVPVQLNRVAVADLEIDGPVGDLSKTGTIWKSPVIVPLQEYYSLPIPKAALFGKQQFALALSSYGSIDKLEYGKTAGAPDALDAAAAVAKSAQGPTAEQQAAMVQGQADLIYQQQRLVICKTTPATCPSK